jgi:hypothetical protein
VIPSRCKNIWTADAFSVLWGCWRLRKRRIPHILASSIKSHMSQSKTCKRLIATSPDSWHFKDLIMASWTCGLCIFRVSCIVHDITCSIEYIEHYLSYKLENSETFPLVDLTNPPLHCFNSYICLRRNISCSLVSERSRSTAGGCVSVRGLVGVCKVIYF